MKNAIICADQIKRSTIYFEFLSESGWAVTVTQLKQAGIVQTCGLMRAELLIFAFDKVTPSLAEAIKKTLLQLDIPVLVFADVAEPEQIVALSEAGASGVVVGDFSLARLPAIIAAAAARFKVQHQLRLDLSAANRKLNERKVIERAKGMLMKQRQLDEDEAYEMMRDMAMKKNMKLVDLSNQLLNTAEMLSM